MSETIIAIADGGFFYAIEIGQDVEIDGLYLTEGWTAAVSAGPGIWHAVATGFSDRDAAIGTVRKMMDDGVRYEAFPSAQPPASS